MTNVPDSGQEIVEYLRAQEAQAVPGFAAQVLEVFLRDMAMRLNVLHEAIGRRDAEATYRVAHTMKGSAGSIGARSLAQSCAELASAGRSGSFDRCEELARDVEAGFRSIQGLSA